MTLLYRVGYYSISDGGYQNLLLDTTSRTEAEELARPAGQRPRNSPSSTITSAKS